MLLVWFVLQLIGWLTKKNVPAGPPGGNVIAVHTKEEYEEAQRKAKESGSLVRTARGGSRATATAVPATWHARMACLPPRQKLADGAARVTLRAAVCGLQRHMVWPLPRDRAQVRCALREGTCSERELCVACAEALMCVACAATVPRRCVPEGRR